MPWRVSHGERVWLARSARWLAPWIGRWRRVAVCVYVDHTVVRPTERSVQGMGGWHIPWRSRGGSPGAWHVVMVVENIPLGADHRLRKQVDTLLAQGCRVTVISTRHDVNGPYRGRRDLALLE